MTADAPPPDPAQTGLPLYMSPPSPCPYLPARTEQRILAFLEPNAAALATPLLQNGFRRMQNMFYRPECPTCRACTPCRIPLADFRPGKSFLRLNRRNGDIRMQMQKPKADAENYALFTRYQFSRHAGGGMDAMSFAEFRTMLEDSPVDTQTLCCRHADGTLAGVMLFDRTGDGLSAVYSFFTPDDNRRSLGTWMVLQLAAQAVAWGLPYVYLGYWIKESPKMAYKAKFQPLEIRMGDSWRRMTRKDLQDQV